MDSETIVELISQSGEACERNKKNGSPNKSMPGGEFFFQDAETWNMRVFQPKCMEDTLKGLESGMKKSLDGLIELTGNYDLDNESVVSEKEGILNGELEENSEILTALNDLWVIQSGLREVESLSEFGELASTLSSLEIARSKLQSFEEQYPSTALSGEIHVEIDKLTNQVTKRAENGWNKAVGFEVPFNGGDIKMIVREVVDDLSLENLYEAIQKIDMNKRPTRVEQFLANLETKIFEPIFQLQVDSVSRTEWELSLSRSGGKLTVDKVVDVLEGTIEYLNDVFSDSGLNEVIIKRFSSILIHSLSNGTLPGLFPEDSGELENFRKRLSRVEEFDKFLQTKKWSKHSELTQWIENFPNEWVLYRKSCYLDRVRTEINKLDLIRKVDAEFGGNNNDGNDQGNNLEAEEDDWNKEWDDDEEENNDEEEDNEDWGWGDEDDTNDNDNNKKKNNNNATNKSDNNNSGKNDVSNIPQAFCSVSRNVDQLKLIIGEFIGEIGTEQSARQLSDVFALFRALSFIIYGDKQIVRYNDLMGLIGSIDNGEIPFVSAEDRGLLAQQANQSISELVDEQQSELTSILAQSRGFRECNPESNLGTCQKAIGNSCHLINKAFTDWSQHGSFPLVCRMVGTLLEAMVTSIMSGIESQEDISEVECGELSKLIGEIQKLVAGLYKDPRGGDDDDDETGSSTKLAAFYIPSWFKFEYFGEILQSTLADIMYLFNENALMDFSTSELIRLIKALFAESAYRKGAIDKILSK